MSNILYITYDGLLEPLGMSQVWQYQKKLGKDHNVIILSYEKSEDLINIHALELEIKKSDVVWVRLSYHKSPSLIATTYDIFYGFISVLRIIKKYDVDFIHSRSYVATIIAYLVNKKTDLNYIFDMRGFWADEKVDGGVWKKTSFLYKFIKYIERKLLFNAEQIVTLTHAGKKDIKSLKCTKDSIDRISVIPTCANLDIFRPFLLEESNIEEDVFVLGYVGSVGTFYMFDEVLKSFKKLIKVKKNSKLIIINKNQHDYIKSCIHKENMKDLDIEVRSADYQDMTKEINAFDAGIFYIKPSFSKRSSSPTRLAEYLGCGKPCITNYGVGDTEYVISSGNVGVILKDFSDDSHIRGIEELLTLVNDPEVSTRCVNISKKYYSLDKGVNEYNKLYSRMIDS
jgi:glycosyltransferase involved in cell wall biosynthesis